MGLGSTEPRREIFYLAIRTKDENKQLDPHFAVTQRENNKTITLNNENSVSGYLIGINHGKYEWPKNSGDWMETISMRLIDKGAEFKVEVSVDTVLGRNMMNRIVGIRDWGWVKVSLYAKNEYAQMFIGNNDQPMNWKYDYVKELKPLVQELPDPRKPGKTIVLYNKVNELLLSEWVKCEALVRDNAKSNPAIIEALKWGVKPATATVPVQLPDATEKSLQEEFDAMEGAPEPTGEPVEPPFASDKDDSDLLPF